MEGWAKFSSQFFVTDLVPHLSYTFDGALRGLGD